MSTAHEPQPTTTTDLGLTRAEEWVVHYVMVEQLTRETAMGERPPWWAHDIVRKLEADSCTFTQYEAWRLRRDLLTYAAGDATPAADVTLATTVAERLGERYGDPPLPS
ncbi:hypothetical protein [Haloarchaeobius sp. DFWS5]|uniref:DUF7853 family protein n=1 Tax=Haloarchaeobius sp. DFWS5 TaxID=3446114 RepID=UPI003EBB690A